MSNSAEHQNRLKKLHEDPRTEKWNTYLDSEEHKNHLKKLHEDSEINAKRIESLKAYHASKPGMSEKQSAKLLENSRSVKNLANLKAYNDSKSIQVKVFDTESNTTAVYASRSEAARAMGVSYPTITKALKTIKDTGVTRLIKGRYQILQSPG
jgi:DNA-binding transcriptional ArsR family regulator